MTLRAFSPLKRIEDLQHRMVYAGIDVVMLSYSRSVLYYAGTVQPAVLIVTLDDYHLIVTSGFDSAAEETWIALDHVRPGNGYKHAKEWLGKQGVKAGRLGLELDVIPTVLYFKIAEIFPRMTVSDVSRVILEQRKIKDAKEVEDTRDACRMVHQGHLRILEVLRQGMTELELSAEVEHAHRKAGHEGLYFVRQFDFFMGRGPVASGANLSRIAGKVQSITGVGLSRSIPLGASRKEIGIGEMIVVDVPTICNGYHSDQSRTYVLGKAPEGCKALYQGLKEIADRVIEELKPGMRSDHLYELAVGFAEERDLEPFFMRIGRDRKKIPFIGHGVGLELNEAPMLSPRSNDILEEGMIFALEMEMTNGPSEVVKLEDTVLMTEAGPELLTITPRGLHEV